MKDTDRQTDAEKHNETGTSNETRTDASDDAIKYAKNAGVITLLSSARFHKYTSAYIP